jgi:EmrB/QacA subfamily drug resistance transporter
MSPSNDPQLHRDGLAADANGSVEQSAVPATKAAPAGTAADQPAIRLSPSRRRLVTWVILLAFFMDVLDTTIVNVAIPSIQTGLGATYAAIQWIIAGYSLAFALFLITGGRLGDIFGYKKMFMLGMAGFTIASALSGLAGSTEMLIAARFLQGGMAAIMVPQILSTIQVTYARDERRNVTGFYGALAGLASVLGPVLGALLISGNIAGLGWRSIFLVNVPIGIAAVIAAGLVQPDARSPHPLRIDTTGVGLILVAMLLLMYPLIEGRELDWPVWTFLSMAASLPAFLVFAWSQQAKDRRDGSPLVVPSLFRVRAFVVGVLINASFYAVVAAFFLTFTIYLQIGLGFTVLAAGLTGIPFSFGIAITAALSGPGAGAALRGVTPSPPAPSSWGSALALSSRSPAGSGQRCGPGSSRRHCSSAAPAWA